ncbi:anion permease [Thermogymnomonas acidicola]|uniref:Probable membrane transporter protein n=1 Tax=Thermogymnomonas acidicola TaxID=399579 RepID=A0AA37BR83_9ARCH|nr:sulfite exporter TauE/SafE family protein [Thermogymnomonas acidicola]GGM69938.1 anion permease [Thermogymnomonas acidicola]
MFPIEYAFAVVSGVLVGFSLGLIGGGGSILAIPLFIYFVGIDNVHAAIGTTALAVSLNSFFNFTQHLRLGNADLRIGSIFAGIGVAGVLAGTTLGLITPGSSLLFYFSIVMVGIGIYMLFERRRERQGAGGNRYGRISLSSLVAGFASGYFGIGGGFLIVPSLLYSSSIGMNRTVGTSLLAVGTFGLVTAIRYGIAGYLYPVIAILYVAGGIIGGLAGARLSKKTDSRNLKRAFAAVIIAVGIYLAVSNFHP